MQKKVSELKRILYPSSHSDVRQKETLLDLKRTKGLQFFLEQTAFGPINACNGCNLCNPNIQETEHYFDPQFCKINGMNMISPVK